MNEMIISPLPDAWILARGHKDTSAVTDLDLLANLLMYAVVHAHDPATFMCIHNLDDDSQQEIGK